MSKRAKAAPSLFLLFVLSAADEFPYHRIGCDKAFVDVAEKLLARSVDGSEHRRLIDSAIDEIGNEDVNNQ